MNKFVHLSIALAISILTILTSPHPNIIYAGGPLPPPSCGINGKPCCPGNTCSPGLTCDGGSCKYDLPPIEPQPPVGPDISKGCIDTAIGCVPIKDEQALAEFFLKWGMGIAAGVALVLISISGYQIMTASGDPRKLQAGKELLTAAITGVVLLALSAFILRVIGVDILGIF